MFVQLGHAGRATSEALSGVQPVSASVDPSFTQNQNIVVTTPQGMVPPSPHRALTLDEVPALIEQYHTAAVNALRAGFDGIEVFAAQGRGGGRGRRGGGGGRAGRGGGAGGGR